MLRAAPVIFFAVLTLGLAACEAPPDKPVWPEITFTHLQPINFDVAEIRIETPYREPIDPPHVGEQFPVSPSRAALQWAEDRLRAVGTRGTVTVVIKESSAVETKLETSGGLKGLFTKEQTEKYLVTIDMEVRVLDPVGPRTAAAAARTRKSNTVREDANMNEREQIWYELTKGALQDFNTGMERQIRATLGNFLKK